MLDVNELEQLQKEVQAKLPNHIVQLIPVLHVWDKTQTRAYALNAHGLDSSKDSTNYAVERVREAFRDRVDA
jgi:hypothetical protein